MRWSDRERRASGSEGANGWRIHRDRDRARPRWCCFTRNNVTQLKIQYADDVVYQMKIHTRISLSVIHHNGILWIAERKRVDFFLYAKWWWQWSEKQFKCCDCGKMTMYSWHWFVRLSKCACALISSTESRRELQIEDDFIALALAQAQTIKWIEKLGTRRRQNEKLTKMKLHRNTNSSDLCSYAWCCCCYCCWCFVYFMRYLKELNSPPVLHDNQQFLSA